MSLCSGIECATVAWKPLGWTPLAFAEIEKFPSAVLQYHYPNIKNLGDITKYDEWSDEYKPDVLIGGIPCQAYSLAGLRKGLDDPRGRGKPLMLAYLGIAKKYKPKWVIIENVVGLLSANEGRAFATLLEGLDYIGYKDVAWNVLESSDFGVPQNRKRLYIIGHIGEGCHSAKVLFKSKGMSGNTNSVKQSPQTSSTTAINKNPSTNKTSFHFGFQPVQSDIRPIVPYRISSYASNAMKSSNPNSGIREVTQSNTLDCTCSNPCCNQGGIIVTDNNSPLSVRRLTCIECERLQGFPDNYTLIPYQNKMSPDSLRYKAIGNSFSAPVIKWIGEQIQMIDMEDNII